MAKISSPAQQAPQLPRLDTTSPVSAAQISTPATSQRDVPGLNLAQAGLQIADTKAESQFIQAQEKPALSGSKGLLQLQITEAAAGTSLMDINLTDEAIDLCLEEAIQAAGDDEAMVFLYGDKRDGVGHAIAVDGEGYVFDRGQPAQHPETGAPLTLIEWEGLPHNQRYTPLGAAQATPLREALQETSPNTAARGEALQALGLGDISQARVADPPNLSTLTYLNVRSAPGARKLGTFPPDTVLTPTGERDGKWVKVDGQLNGQTVTGWVHSSFTKEVASTPPPPSLETTANLNVRASAGGTRLDTFPAGTPLTPSGERDGKWLEVTGEIDGESVTGWVHSNYVEALVETPPLPSANLESMRDAAHTLVDNYADNYGVDDAWFNIDPNHALPDNVSLGGLRGKWKCNLFAGNTMVQAGFEPPYYGNRGKGEYPNANQLYKWSDAHAGNYNNKTHFEMRGELEVASLPHGERLAAIEALLAKAEPGDMIIVDHMGTDIADGGHCRVLVSKNADGTFDFAQASRDNARVRNEAASNLTGEETIWILRPNKPAE